MVGEKIVKNILFCMITALRRRNNIQNLFGLILILLLIFPAESVATCYIVHDKSDVLVYRSSRPPFDLSVPLSQGIASSFPGGYLIQLEGTLCPPIPKKDEIEYKTAINNDIRKRVARSVPGKIEIIQFNDHAGREVERRITERERRQVIAPLTNGNGTPAISYLPRYQESIATEGDINNPSELRAGGRMTIGDSLSGSNMPGANGGMTIGGSLSGSIMPGANGGMIVGGPLSGSIMP